MTGTDSMLAIFDNAGGITLQLGNFAHYYNNPDQAARDYHDYMVDGTAEGWEGHEEESLELNPTQDEINNGGYRVYSHSEIIDEVNSDETTGWHNIDEFCLALGGRLEDALGK